MPFTAVQLVIGDIVVLFTLFTDFKSLFPVLQFPLPASCNFVCNQKIDVAISAGIF
jgi:hypothetical protein